MAFSPGYKARLLLDDVSWSALLNDISLPRTIEMLDVTTFADNGVKRFIPGLDSSSITMSGFVDATATAAGSGWSESGPLTYAPVGLTTGSQTELISAHKTSFEVSTQVGAAAAFSLAGQTDGEQITLPIKNIDLRIGKGASDRDKCSAAFGTVATPKGRINGRFRRPIAIDQFSIGLKVKSPREFNAECFATRKDLTQGRKICEPVLLNQCSEHAGHDLQDSHLTSVQDLNDLSHDALGSRRSNGQLGACT